jgi:hypothetical protein
VTEIPIPLKDLKVGVKVVGEVAKNTFEPTKAPLKRYLQKKVANLFRKKSF